MKSNEIILEDFANPAHSWNALNDPVMGGQSSSTVSIKGGLGIFEGEVVDVSFLQAPGFITMRGEGDYADVSSCDTFRLTARASEPYEGYRISFGIKTVPGNRFARGFKANFLSPVGTDMVDIDIPFRDFTVRWDDKTGDPVKTCQEDEAYCPDIDTLKNMKSISIWGEGVDGKIKLEIDSIKAVGCTGKVSNPAPAPFTTIGGDSQGSATLSPLFLFGVASAAFFGAIMKGLFTSISHNYSSVNKSNNINPAAV
eukprot:CAMPEP_0197823524 /NCGR_PEP_ID=MMETSP1437-20131217/868_1 /TAXON_ID=49252 ORGANISM="Eucampia antarctica, Strain CCMP1452" /NCGR_SAMPLE_ID=MMETSP1437 /ASSEMBLY_ACC=CAM_ASM_001096 /LENGTH=254 /DNA_ID=CAMNT_0043422745 /DNA_START=103 /DNA_END=867 /DNA_ORIENTATION=-